MLIVKKTVSLLLWVAYTIGMAHGAVPHSHFLGSHKAERSAQCLIQSESDDAELMRLLIHIFSESETTDIADYFVNETSDIDVSTLSARCALAAVLVSFVYICQEEVDSSNVTFAEEAGHTLLAHDQALSRRGPPVVS
ncbi:MAG: hypothetical protein H6603_09230 [Flavobacteriales bacterium]|nr:hypothetical protein [Flavobacteriales bacterium]MCB9190040.1 hypothetical protein [Flavobacteriales bacterium]MCB9205142.1 hypothetical protein [Flavobacteriales bacterium]